MRPTVLDCLEIADGEWFEFEDLNGNFCVEPKDMFMGCYADTSLGQGIYFKAGYCWRWYDDGKARGNGHPRSEVFDTEQQAFEAAFDHFHYYDDIVYREWLNYASSHGLQYGFIVDAEMERYLASTQEELA
jgi:hypothetical protein